MSERTTQMTKPWISACCEGERCFCDAPAAAKVGEEIMPDDPFRDRHNLTAYVCAGHFRQIFGERGVAFVDDWRRNRPTPRGNQR